MVCMYMIVWANRLLLLNCSIRNVTAEVGASVLRAAVAEGLAEGHGVVGSKELEHMSKVCNLSSY
jgi:hypothetical protein